ncbi:MAG TPA: VOC family protein [Candidatus Ruania gallistercoris]|uniref:VOC family protein n=1 Tax=Candidatus Ruania gallistercoris TaxID=2838746 RepID=A0A9D2J5A6_9MICO|nr:VOC family protein [Candidatus Ruania gallistercoris]
MTNTETSTPTIAPIPAGYTSLTPFLVVTDGAAAIDFYTAVFGARVTNRTDAPDGTVAHAELDFGTGRLQLADANPAYGLVAPTVDAETDAVTHSICLYCEDVDAVVARARAAGATVREEVSTFVTGDRFGSILDPFGQRWAIMTRVEDVSDEEAQRRVDAWMAEQG